MTGGEGEAPTTGYGMKMNVGMKFYEYHIDAMNGALNLVTSSKFCHDFTV